MKPTTPDFISWPHLREVLAFGLGVILGALVASLALIQACLR